jgi:hypothetical protein
MTVGELEAELRMYPTDYEIVFSSDPGLRFNQVKQKGDKLIQVQFLEIVYKDHGGKWHVDE